MCFFDYQLVKALPITGSFNSNRGNDIAFIVAKVVLLMIKAQRLEDEFQIRNTTIRYFGCINNTWVVYLLFDILIHGSTMVP